MSRMSAAVSTRPSHSRKRLKKETLNLRRKEDDANERKQTRQHVETAPLLDSQHATTRSADVATTASDSIPAITTSPINTTNDSSIPLATDDNIKDTLKYCSDIWRVYVKFISHLTNVADITTLSIPPTLAKLVRARRPSPTRSKAGRSPHPSERSGWDETSSPGRVRVSGADLQAELITPSDNTAGNII